MGMLAEFKSRKSIGKDPNNTKWTRDTTTFGQRILRSQGWEPGQFLGAKDAPHSELHTAANASYIRVALKDDMKGLGFNKAKEDEVTGLDVFSDLLSRLNGKSQAEVDQDKAARLVIKTNRYVEQRWGPMRFVRGGLLVGDVLEEAGDSKKTSSTTTTTAAAKTIEEGDDSKRKSKKRKVESLDDSSSESSSDEEERQKKENKKRRKEEKKAKAEKKEDKKKRKDKKEKKAKTTLEGATLTTSTSEEVAEPDENSSSADDVKAKKSKKSKRDKKDKKEQKGEKKKKRKKAASESQQDGETSDTNPSATSAATGTGTSGISTPVLAGSGTSTPLLTQRNFVRSRFIAQKQRVLMDTEALNQILMIKT